MVSANSDRLLHHCRKAGYLHRSRHPRQKGLPPTPASEPLDGVWWHNKDDHLQTRRVLRQSYPSRFVLTSTVLVTVRRCPHRCPGSASTSFHRWRIIDLLMLSIIDLLCLGLVLSFEIVTIFHNTSAVLTVIHRCNWPNIHCCKLLGLQHSSWCGSKSTSSLLTNWICILWDPMLASGRSLWPDIAS